MKFFSASLERIKSEPEIETQSDISSNSLMIKNKKISNRSIFTIKDGLKLIQLNTSDKNITKKISGQNNSFINITKNKEIKKNYDKKRLEDINLINRNSLFKNKIIDGVMGVDGSFEEKSKKKNMRKSGRGSGSGGSQKNFDDFSNCNSSYINSNISQTQNLFFKSNKIKQNKDKDKENNNHNNFKKIISLSSRNKLENINGAKNKQKDEIMKVVLFNKTKETKSPKNLNINENMIFSTNESNKEVSPRNIYKVTLPPAEPEPEGENKINQKLVKERINDGLYRKEEGICKKAAAALKINFSD